MCVCLIKNNSIKFLFQFDVDPYELPYAALVGQDPKLQDMYTAVCIKKIRPEVPSRWNRK